MEDFELSKKHFGWFTKEFSNACAFYLCVLPTTEHSRKGHLTTVRIKPELLRFFIHHKLVTKYNFCLYIANLFILIFCFPDFVRNTGYYIHTWIHIALTFYFFSSCFVCFVFTNISKMWQFFTSLCCLAFCVNNYINNLFKSTNFNPFV